jgi:hypothetical protein
MLVNEISQVAILVFGGNKDVTLKEFGGRLKFGRHLDSDGIYKGGSLQLLYLGGHGGREEHGPAASSRVGNYIQNLVQLLFKIHGKHTIGLIHDQIFYFSQVKALGVG